MNNVKKHLNLLGHKVKDRVSNFEGVVISMSFDLYGCIQADVRPFTLDENGQVQNGIWMDVSRLIIVSGKALMDAPDYKYGKISEGKKGPANLPVKI